jgi:hypothetical protein
LFLHLIFALILVVFINFKQNFNMRPPSNILQLMNEFVELSCLAVVHWRPPNVISNGGMLFHEWVSMSGEHEWWTRFCEQERIFSINFVHVRKYII